MQYPAYTQVDKCVRDLFVENIESTVPPTEAEENLLARSLEHADLRLVDRICVIENDSTAESKESTTTPIASGISKMRTNLSSLLNKREHRLKWRRIQGGDDLAIKKFTKFVDEDYVKWGKATTTVHTSPEEALAWLWDCCSNDRMENHRKKNGHTLRKYYDPKTQLGEGADGVKESREHREQEKESRTRHVVVHKAIARTVDMRESNSKLVWGKFTSDRSLSKQGDTAVGRDNAANGEESVEIDLTIGNDDHDIFVIGFQPARDRERYVGSIGPRPKQIINLLGSLPVSSLWRSIPKRSYRESENDLPAEELLAENAEAVQLLETGVWVLRRLAANICDVTFVVRIEDEGDIPVSLVNMGVNR